MTQASRRATRGPRRTTGRQCSIDNCTDKHEAKGYRDRHYRRWQTYGDPLHPPRRINGNRKPKPGTPLPKCAEDGCPRKARSRRAGSRCRKHGGPAQSREQYLATFKCTKYRCPGSRQVGKDFCARCERERDSCSVRGCGEAKGDNGLCVRHTERLNHDNTCTIDDCAASRHRAGLCGRHANELGHEIHECGHPTCRVPIWRVELCGLHVDIGVDFAAGNWFDWVAVDHMFSGRWDRDRRPTVLEVRALVEKADRRFEPYAQLASRMGITVERFESWRKATEHLAPMILEAA